MATRQEIAAAQRLLLIPRDWLVYPSVGRLPKIQRVIAHWTAGNHTCNQLDRDHYHLIVERKGSSINVVKGTYSPYDNEDCKDGKYAEHVHAANTGSLGISACAMAGAKEGGPYGDFPLLPDQWEALAKLAAQALYTYRIPLTDHTVLQHGEAQERLGAIQNGKWDCCELPWQPHLTHAQVGNLFRQRVSTYLRLMKEGLS